MTAKKILSYVLILFVIVSLGYIGVKEVRERAVSATSESDNDYRSIEEKPGLYHLTSEYTGDVDVVCYFMTTQRCTNCVHIETYTKEAIDERFVENMNDRTLAWKMINVDEFPNRHFIKDFDLHTKSVVLVKIRDGKQVEWKNLDQVWANLSNKELFKKYVESELITFIAKG